MKKETLMHTKSTCQFDAMAGLNPIVRSWAYEGTGGI